MLEVCSPKPHSCPARRKQVNERFSLVGILLPSPPKEAGEECPAAGSHGQAERGLFSAVPSPHGCSVFYPLQEEEPDSESEKLVVREPEDEDGECRGSQRAGGGSERLNLRELGDGLLPLGRAEEKGPTPQNEGICRGSRYRGPHKQPKGSCSRYLFLCPYL